MIDSYITKYIGPYLDGELKVLYPKLTLGRRKFVIRKCMAYMDRYPAMVYGGGIHIFPKDEGEFYKMFRFKVKRNVIYLGFSVD